MHRRLTDPMAVGIASSILLHALVFFVLLQKNGEPERHGAAGAETHWIYMQLVAAPAARPATPENAASLLRPASRITHRQANRPLRQRLVMKSPRIPTAPTDDVTAPSLAQLSGRPVPTAPAKTVQGPVAPQPAGSVEVTRALGAGPPGPAVASSSASAGLIGTLPLFYRREVSTLIAYRLRPPPAASGVVVVRLHLRRDGTVLDARVVQGSGTPALDAEARDVVLRIRQFDWLPADAIPGIADFSIDQPIRFHG